MIVRYKLPANRCVKKNSQGDTAPTVAGSNQELGVSEK
jgi:hypothetical protein